MKIDLPLMVAAARQGFFIPCGEKVEENACIPEKAVIYCHVCEFSCLSFHNHKGWDDTASLLHEKRDMP